MGGETQRSIARSYIVNRATISKRAGQTEPGTSLM
jgi:hypothetical protein